MNKIKYLIPFAGFINSVDKLQTSTGFKQSIKWFGISTLLLVWSYFWFGLLMLFTSYEIIKGNWKLETVCNTFLILLILLILLISINLVKGIFKKD